MGIGRKEPKQSQPQLQRHCQRFCLASACLSLSAHCLFVETERASTSAHRRVLCPGTLVVFLNYELEGSARKWMFIFLFSSAPNTLLKGIPALYFVFSSLSVHRLIVPLQRHPFSISQIIILLQTGNIASPTSAFLPLQRCLHLQQHQQHVSFDFLILN